MDGKRSATEGCSAGASERSFSGERDGEYWNVVDDEARRRERRNRARSEEVATVDGPRYRVREEARRTASRWRERVGGKGRGGEKRGTCATEGRWRGSLESEKGERGALPSGSCCRARPPLAASKQAASSRNPVA